MKIKVSRVREKTKEFFDKTKHKFKISPAKVFNQLKQRIKRIKNRMQASNLKELPKELLVKIKNLSLRNKVITSCIAAVLLVTFVASIIIPYITEGFLPNNITLDFQNYNVRVGDSHKVYANGVFNNNSTRVIPNLSCKSSNNKVLQVTDGNIIIGKKEGKVKLKCSYWFRNVTTTVTVHKVENAFSPSNKFLKSEFDRLEKVSIKEKQPRLTGVSDGQKVYVNWTKVEGAKKYVLASSMDNKKFTKVYESSESNGFKDVDVKNGNVFYKLSALDNDDKEISSKQIGVKHKKENNFDAKDDADGDGLSNIDELRYGSDMHKKDSDGDGILDKQAVEINGNGLPTQLLNAEDKKDIKLKAADVKEKDGQVAKKFTAQDDSINVKLIGNKNVKSGKLSIAEDNNPYLKTQKGFIGGVKDIAYDGKGMKEAQITLKYNEKDLNGTKEDDLTLYYINKKSGKLEKVKDVKVDKKNKTVSGVTTHFSPYAIGDEKILGSKTVAGALNTTDIIFLIDNSQAMKENGGLDAARKLVTKFSDYFGEINKEQADVDKARFGVVTFSETAKLITAPTIDPTVFKNAVEAITETNSNSNIADGLMVAREAFEQTNRKKMVVLVTDGYDKNDASDAEIAKIAELYGSTMTINAVATGTTRNETLMMKVAENAKGTFLKLAGKNSVAEVDVEEIYQKIVKQMFLKYETRIPDENLKTIFSQMYKGYDYDGALKMYAKTSGNILTGNFSTTYDDFKIDLDTKDFTFTRTYNSDDSYRATLLGNGWRTNYDTNLVDLPRYGKAKENINLKYIPGDANDVSLVASAETTLEYVTNSDGTIATTTINGVIWEKFKYENQVMYLRKGSTKDESKMQDMGGGIQVTYPSGSTVVFKDKGKENGKDKGLNSAGIREYITPYGMSDRLIYGTDKLFYLIKADGETFIYSNDGDNKGKLIATVDSRGNKQTVEYDGNKINKVTDITGRGLMFTYDYKGMIYRVTDSLGRYVEYIRDDNENLTGVLDKNGQKTVYSYYGYEEDYRLKEIIDVANKVVLKNEYDIFGRLIVQYKNGSAAFQAYKDIYKDKDDKVVTNYDRLIRYYINERGIESSVEFNPVTMNPMVTTDAEGNTKKYKYYIDFDSNGSPTDITDVKENDDTDKKIKAQEEKGNVPTVEEEIDPKGNVTRKEYDKFKNLVKTTDIKGIKAYTYLENSTDSYNSYDDYLRCYQIKTVKEIDGSQIAYEYVDNSVKVKKEIYNNGNVKEYVYATGNESGSRFGLVKKELNHVKDKAGNMINNFSTLTYEYDDYGSLAKTTDALGSESREYDISGRLLWEVDAKNHKTSYRYDDEDRVIEVKDAKGYTQKTVYDDQAGKKTVIDQEGKESAIIYDQDEKPLEVIDANGKKVIYAYDSMGNEVAMTDQIGNTSYKAYDKLGKLMATIDFMGNVMAYKYDVLGNVKKVIDPKGYETVYEYNDKNQKKSEEQYYTDINPDGTIEKKTKKMEYTYDANDQVLTETNSSTGLTIKTDYDMAGRPTKVTKGYGKVDSEGKSLAKEVSYEYDYIQSVEELGIKESLEVMMVTDVLGNKTKQYKDIAGNVRKSVDAKGYITRYQYDPKGNVVKVIDAKDNATVSEYDELYRLVKTTLPDGSTTGADYYPTGTVKTKTDAKDNVTSYKYNNLNKVEEVTDPENRITSYKYYDTGKVKSVTDAWNRTTFYEYDPMGRVVKETDPLGYETSRTYDWAGNVLTESSKNKPDVVTKYTYNELYRPVLTENREGGKTYTRYDSVGNVLSVTDPLKNTTMYEYDDFGNKRKEILPGDSSVKASWTKYDYNANEMLEKVETSLGKIEEREYNELYQVVATKMYDKDKPGDAITTATKYDELGNPEEITDANDNVTINKYNSLNQLKESKIQVSGKTITKSFDYDKNGNLTKEIDYRGNVTEYAYDVLNRKKATIDAYGNTIAKVEYYPDESMEKTYDALGNVTEKHLDKKGQTVKTVLPNKTTLVSTYDKEGNLLTTTDAKNQVTTFAYDDMNRLKKVTNAKNEETDVTYDLNGNMLTITDGRRNTTTYEYNIIGKPVKRIDPGGKKDGAYVTGRFESYTYNEDGSLKSNIDRNGNISNYIYDKFGRLKSRQSGDEQLAFEYDNNSNLTETTGKTGTTSRKYDELNRCTEKSVPKIGKSVYNYDIIDGLSSDEEGYVAETTVDPKGNETLKVFDKVGRLSRVTADNLTTTYDYHANGARSSQKIKNGLESSYIYNEVNQLKTLTNSIGNNVLEEYSYDYDDNGNLESKTDKKGTTSYIYDALNRLESVTEPGNKVSSYTYDAAGNRATETIDGKTSTYDYDECNRLTGLQKNDEKYKFDYDNNGNELKETKVSANAESVILENVYNEFNQVTETKSGDKTIKNTYNADGYRVQKDVDGDITQYLYESSNVVLETDKDNKEKARNVYGMNLLSRTVDETTYSYMYNGSGDVTGLVDAAGEVKASYYYDAFGNPTESTGDLNNPYTYNGYQYEKESGLYYLNSRYYDPQIARFLSEDTYRGTTNDPLSLNIYTYCENNPLIATDPSGHSSFWNDLYNTGKKLVSKGCKIVKKAASTAWNDYIVPAAKYVWNEYIVPAATWAYDHIVEPAYNYVVKPAVNWAGNQIKGNKKSTASKVTTKKVSSISAAQKKLNDKLKAEEKKRAAEKKYYEDVRKKYDLPSYLSDKDLKAMYNRVTSIYTKNEAEVWRAIASSWNLTQKAMTSCYVELDMYAYNVGLASSAQMIYGMNNILNRNTENIHFNLLCNPVIQSDPDLCNILFSSYRDGRLLNKLEIETIKAKLNSNKIYRNVVSEFKDESFMYGLSALFVKLVVAFSFKKIIKLKYSAFIPRFT